MDLALLSASGTVLVVNTGSSSIKLSVVDGADEVGWAREIDAPAGEAPEERVRELVSEAKRFDAVGHRIVHGGTRFSQAAVVDDEVRAELERFVPLAPLHQPRGLRALDVVRGALPDTLNVACFDTAFHATLPPAAFTYPVPEEWRETYGIRRFGFHGLSHRYAARRAEQLLGADGSDLRIVTCHLGAGSSLCAVRDGRSVDTTMGFTPLEGLMMATRSGSFDPGALLWLQREMGLPADTIADALERGSGLKGLAGTSDMRAVLEAADRGDTEATLAIDVYVHRLSAAIAAMTAPLGGLDAVVFTGGVGENAARIRQEATARLAHLGVNVDPELNRRAEGDAVISPQGSPGAALIVRAREDLEIAREARAALKAGLGS